MNVKRIRNVSSYRDSLLTRKSQNVHKGTFQFLNIQKTTIILIRKTVVSCALSSRWALRWRVAVVAPLCDNSHQLSSQPKAGEWRKQRGKMASVRKTRVIELEVGSIIY